MENKIICSFCKGELTGISATCDCYPSSEVRLKQLLKKWDVDGNMIKMDGYDDCIIGEL